MIFNALNLLVFSVVIMSLLGSCTEKEFNPDDPAGSFAIAREPYDDEEYDIALSKLGEYKARFPYSQYSVLAELYMANSLFELARYDEAAVSYEQFVKLHPKHEKVDFAMFRAGECHWADAPGEPDRDQGLTKLAVESWKKLLARFPESKFAEEARRLIAQGDRRVADNMAFSAKFYCKQEIYHACAYRYLQLAEQFPNFADLRQLSYAKAADAFDQLARQKEAEPNSDKNVYFQKMSAAELLARANELRSLAK